MTRFLIKDLVKTNVSCYGKSDNWEYINYLDTGSLTNNNISEIMRLIPKMDIIPSRAKRKVKRGDILYSTVRPNQCHFGYMEKPQENMLVSTGFAVLEPKKEAVNGKYLYYYLTQKEIVNYLQSIAEGTVSTYPSVQPKDIEKINIDLPDIKIQDKIAAILSAYDDLIEKNNRKIAILQQMAEELYKEWFVRFRFPGHKTAKFKDGIPEGWEIKRIYEFGKIETGKTPSMQVAEYYGADIPFVKTPDMHDNMWTIETEEMLSVKGSDSQPKKLLPANSIMVSCIGTGGVVSINTIPSHTNQQINSIILNDLKHLEWLYFTCVSLKPTIVSYGATGATMTNLSKGKFERLKILYPGTTLIYKYHENTKDIFVCIKNLMYLNRNLTQQRDLLLPRLMSGKLKVKA